MRLRTLPLSMAGVLLGILLAVADWKVDIYVAILIVLFLILRLPADNNVSQTSDTFARLNALLHNRGYREGVIAEFFYIATQVACWTFIIQHGVRIFMAEGMTEQAAESLAEKFNIAAIVCFAACRFLCTWLMRWFLPSRMLSTLGIIARQMGVSAIYRH